MNTVDYVLPDWTINALFNKDHSGLSWQRSEMVTDFIIDNDMTITDLSPIALEAAGLCDTNDMDGKPGECSIVTFKAGEG